MTTLTEVEKPTRFAKFFAPALAALGQGLGGLQVLVIFWWARAASGPDALPLADAYFYLFSWATIPAGLMGQGVLYSLWIRNKWRSRRALVTSVLGCSVVSIAVYGASLPYMFATREGTPFALVATMAGSSVVVAISFIVAAHAASRGNAWLLSGLTVPTNATSLACFVVSGGSIEALAVGALVGGSVFVAFAVWWCNRHGWGFEANSHPDRGEFFSISMRAFTGYGLVLVWQSAVLALPAGAGSLYNVSARIAQGLATIVVNAPLPRLINALTIKTRQLWRYHALVTSSALAVGVVAGALCLLWPVGALYIAAFTALWLAALSLNLTTQRWVTAATGHLSLLYVAGVGVAFMLVGLLVARSDFFSLTMLLALVSLSEIAAATAASIGTHRVRATLTWALAITVAVVALWSLSAVVPLAVTG